MNEARLNEIERLFGNDAAYYMHKVDDFGATVRELIAALRDAWRERDVAAQIHDSLLSDGMKVADRAARAEAEVKQLREDAGKFVVETAESTVKLQAVRSAAEEVIRHLGPSSNPWSNFSGEAYEAVIRLRRALASAKNPAR